MIVPRDCQENFCQMIRINRNTEIKFFVMVDLKHNYDDMPVMLYLKRSLSRFVRLRIANDFFTKANK